MIDARNVSLAYDDSVVLAEVSLQVRDGEMLAIVGPNGAGKSTLLRALAGLHSPERGEVRVDGDVLSTMAPGERARRIALVEAEGGVPEMTVREVVAQGRLPHRPWWRWSELPEDEEIVAAAIARAQLGEHAERALETLSSGEQQRVWVAVALAQQASMLLFDEPTSHLDLPHAHRVLGLLRELSDDGAAVAVVLHDLNHAAAYADRIALVGRGALLADGPPEQVYQEELLTLAYEAPIVVRHDEDGSLSAFAKPPKRRRKQGSHDLLA